MRLIACLLVVCACDQKRAVVVEGAVELEGAVAFDSTWVVEDYVTAAVPLAEADVDRLTLIRDSVDAATGERVLTHTALDPWVRHVPDPSDLIRVPFRRHPVSFEQAYEVRDLDLIVDDRRFKIPRGTLAVAEIASGPVGGVLTGEGKVFDTGSGELLTPFHYVYLRADFDRMAAILGQASEVTRVRETLEDAVEVHRLHHRAAGFLSEHAVRKPVAGTLEAVPGIWLNPRSERTPGHGMRRRRFPDGRVWTTFSDGRQRWMFPDGRVIVAHPGGMEEIRETDGRLVHVYPNGMKRVRHPDGSREVMLASGSRKLFRPDGTVTYDHFGGTSVTIYKDGRRDARYPDGMQRVEFPDGTAETTYPDGRTERKLLSGWTEVEAPDGVQVQIDPDGRQMVRRPDGTRIYELANGVRVEWHRDGSVRTQFPDGTRQVRDVLGKLTRYAPDGRIVEREIGGAGDHASGPCGDEGWELDVVDTARDAPYLSSEAKEVVRELNKVRTDPPRYAEEVVKPLLAFYEGRHFRLPGRGTVLTREGAAAARELYEELVRTDPVGTVRAAEGLSAAAVDHVRDQGPEGSVGHIGRDGSTPAERVSLNGRSRLTGESIAYGPLYGRVFLLQLLVDDGVEDRGHRRALLDPRFRMVGVATGPHSVFQRMCDIVLSDHFADG